MVDEIARQAEQDLRFKVEMQVETENALIRRAIVQVETFARGWPERNRDLG